MLSTAASRHLDLHLLKKEVSAFQTRPLVKQMQSMSEVRTQWVLKLRRNTERIPVRVLFPSKLISTRRASALHSLSLVRGGDIVPYILPHTTSVTLVISTLLASCMLATGAALFVEPVGYAKACWKGSYSSPRSNRRISPLWITVHVYHYFFVNI